MRRRDHHGAERHGRWAETWAVWWLRFKGYRIVARNWRCPSGEIDIIARRGRVLALVEVKARDAIGIAGEAVGARQQRRISRATAAFLASRPDLARLDARFDAILVMRGKPPRHLPGAWVASH